MLRTDWKHTIAYFFLAAFLLLRVANMHTVSHLFTDVETEHCELCTLIASTNQGTPLQVALAQATVVSFFYRIFQNNIVVARI